jgi:hypothetical protein
MTVNISKSKFLQKKIIPGAWILDYEHGIKSISNKVDAFLLTLRRPKDKSTTYYAILLL